MQRKIEPAELFAKVRVQLRARFAQHRVYRASYGSAGPRREAALDDDAILAFEAERRAEWSGQDHVAVHTIQRLCL
jgi:hypothetical protein